MSRHKIIQFLSVISLTSFAQNDQDAIRYSRPGVGGSSRFMAMGGAFGAVGADVSCGAYNPAGLGLFRKGEISFSGGLKFINNTGNIYKTSTSTTDASFVFNNFGIAVAWKSAKDEESRHVLSFANTQLQNFNSSIRMDGYTNNSSIGKDMMNLANYEGNTKYLNPGYEGMGYYSFLLDSANGGFVSLVDPKRSVRQTRDLVTKGRQNEINISYAYTYKDKYYIGVSLGLPRVEYESTMTHTEHDDRDSMRIFYDTTGLQVSDTYVDALPLLSGDYEDRLGFRSMTYSEYFKTTGTGVNLKIGGMVRVSEALRLGAYFHTPTIYNLTDTYINSISVAFDKNPNHPDALDDPEDGGYFKYKLVTPARISANAAYLIGKLAVIGLDYEFINYKNATLSTDNLNDFSAVNTTIKTKYKGGHTVRLGGELNLKPVMIRAGYVMQGSPFGDSFSGQFVRHTISFGLGFRGTGRWYADILFARAMTSEDYFPFTTLNTQAKLDFKSNMIGATVGIKF